MPDYDKCQSADGNDPVYVPTESTSTLAACTALIQYDICNDNEGYAYCVLHPLGCSNATDLRLENQASTYAGCLAIITTDCLPVDRWKRCDNGSAVNCVIESDDCTETDGWVESPTETLDDVFATKCACESYEHYVVCLQSDGENYECVNDYNACPADPGSEPVRFEISNQYSSLS